MSIYIPKISIITIVYNGIDGIKSTIESVLNQNYTNLEFIVIDGNSSDGTQKVVEQFLNNISFFVSERDHGISDAFNKGIKHATGDLIGLVNAGDILAPNALIHVSNAYNSLERKNHQFVLHGNIQMGIPQGKVYRPFDLRTFSYQMAVWHPTAFVGRNIYEIFQYRTDFKIAMDYDLFSRLYAHGVAFSHINETLVYMDLKGLSNKNAIFGFKEVMYASRINFKIPYLITLMYFYYRCTLFYLIKLKRCLV